MALSLWEQKMKLVKISNEFFNECRKNNVHRELLFNEDGRPSVLIVKLKYKDQYHKFVVPLRSNISPKTPKYQYFSLPPNQQTKPHHSHGIHYIKLFPIEDKYVQSYLINEPFDILVKKIIDDNETDIIKSCQEYLQQCESGNKHFMTPDIDGIMNMLYTTKETN